MKRIKISTDYSTSLGGRYIKDGEHSGEEFRVRLIEPLFSGSADLIEIDFDDTTGYSTAFLHEVFSGLVQKFGYKECKRRLRFVSNDDPLLIKEVEMYMSGFLFDKEKL